MVKIGLIVDGAAESQALRKLTQRIDIKGIQLLNPRYVDMQPKSTAKQIARAADIQIRNLIIEKAHRVIVLIDREDRADCAGDFAQQISQAFISLGHDRVNVVVKNKKLENWLIADTQVFARLRGRFSLTKIIQRAISPNKADTISDAEGLLNKIVLKGEYHKRHDAEQLLAMLDYEEVGRNSRSFRRFLRLLGHPHYSDQSKLPCIKE